MISLEKINDDVWSGILKIDEKRTNEDLEEGIRAYAPVKSKLNEIINKHHKPNSKIVELGGVLESFLWESTKTTPPLLLLL